MIWGISCLHLCTKSADHKEGNTCSEVPIERFISERWNISTLVENRMVIHDVNKAEGGGGSVQFAYVVMSGVRPLSVSKF